jgi:hypothetical protein
LRFASGRRKGAVFSLEAVFALLAATSLLAIASLHSQGAHEGIARVQQYELLNDFLAVRGKAGLSGEYVARSGACLEIEEVGAEAVFFPADCEGGPHGDVVSTTRIVCDGGVFKEITASLWRK